MRQAIPFKVATLIVTVLAFSLCKPKYGTYEVVDISEGKYPSQEIFIKFLEEEVENDPDNVENYLKLADVYLSSGDNAKAKKLLQEGVVATEGDIALLLKLSGVYLDEKDEEKLAELIKQIRKIDPENLELLKISAGYALLRKNYTNAIFFANRTKLSNPYDDQNINILAQAKLINKDSLTALATFEEAFNLKASYQNFEPMFELAVALDEIENAESYLATFQENNPDINCCAQTGSLLNKKGQRDSARVVLWDCLKNFPEKEKLKFELGKNYLKTDPDSSMLFLNDYLKEYPDNFSALMLKAGLLENKSYYTEAKSIYNNVIELDSTYTLASYRLNNLENKVAYLRLKRRKESVQKELDVLKPLNSKELN